MCGRVNVLFRDKRRVFPFLQIHCDEFEVNFYVDQVAQVAFMFARFFSKLNYLITVTI